MNKSKLRAIAAALAAAALVAFAGSTQASAAPQPVAPKAAVVQTGPNTVGAVELKNNGISYADYGLGSIFGVHLANNTVPWLALQSSIRNEIRAAEAPVSTARIVNDAVTETKLAPSVRAKLNADPTNVQKTCAPVALAHTGGTFKTLKTKVCEFDLPAGTWMINTSAFFARTAAGAEGVRPQMALRVGASTTAFGVDYGTIMGTEISASADREMTGSSTKVVTVPAGGVTVEAFGHGYQDNAGDTDGGKISAAADVVAVKIAA